MTDGSRGTVLVWVLAAVLGGLALWRLGARDGDAAGSPVRIERSPGVDQASTRARRGAGEGRSSIYVHVAGAVRRPGLVRVPDGSRVAVAVGRAGGPTRKAELAGVNLAARLEDGQQVIVPVAGAVAAAAGAAGSAAAPPGTAGTVKPSLGTATVDQLDELDGIGPTLAERIVAYRTEHGGFGSIGELREVDGIGEKRFEALREALQP
jgi:competence protein ComEA